MDRAERVKALMERAENLGVSLKFYSGLIAVELPATGDPERQDAIIAELGKYRSDVRALVEGRAVAAHAKDFFGQRIWSEDGDGVLTGASSDGSLDVSMKKEGLRSTQTQRSNAKSVLINLDKGAGGASYPHNDEQKSEKPRRGIFGFLGRGPGKD